MALPRLERSGGLKWDGGLGLLVGWSPIQGEEELFHGIA